MKSFKIALATTIALLIAGVAIAADQPKKQKGPRLSPIAQTMLRIDQVKAAVESLDLSDEQKEKLGKIRDDFDAKKKTILEKMGDVLTDEQKQTAKDAMEKADQTGKKGRRFYQSLETSLKFTDEQKQKMEPIGKELQTLVADTMKQVKDVLTPEQRDQLQQKVDSAGKKGKKKDS
jgi:Spy/CpxP family protein refolding chaperone